MENEKIIKVKQIIILEISTDHSIKVHTRIVTGSKYCITTDYSY